MENLCAFRGNMRKRTRLFHYKFTQDKIKYLSDPKASLKYHLLEHLRWLLVNN